MTYERVALRLDNEDRINLTSIATALNDQRPASSAPWHPQTTVTRCLRAAHRNAGEAARKGELIDGSATNPGGSRHTTPPQAIPAFLRTHPGCQ